MAKEPEPKELTPEQQGDLDDAARMLLGMVPPPSEDDDEGEPAAA